VTNCGVHAVAHSSDMKGALAGYKMIPIYICAWGPVEYVKGMDEVVRVVGEVNPDVVVVDPIFNIGIGACRSLGRKWVVLIPNTLKEAVGTQQSV